MNTIPKYPSGHHIGKEFVAEGEPYGLKVGLITRVDELTMKADVKILTGGGGDRHEVELTQGMAGPRSFWGGVPEVNSLVILGYRRRHKNLYETMILGYIPVGSRIALKFDPLAPDDPANVSAEDKQLFDELFGGTIRYKRLKLRPGNVGGMSSEGAEMVLSKDIRMVNRAGDLFELRDAERAIVAQSIHRVENEAGVLRLSGPVRRGGFFLPPDVFRKDGKTLKDVDPERYFGRTVLKRFTNASAQVLDVFNDETTFPPVTYSNGRRVHYPVTTPAVNFEDIDTGGGAEPFTEWRMEMAHSTDCTQEVREEIDGFQADRKPLYIEHVMGTVVGNDTSSETGQRQYAKVLRPKIFDDFESTRPGVFALEECPRSPTDDLEAFTTAGAYLFRMNPPAQVGGFTDNSVFAVAVSKQGKLFVNIPGSRVERYPSGTKNVSAEINCDGALKARFGAATPDGIAMHLTLEGGAVFDFRGGSAGKGLEFRSHSSMNFSTVGPQDTEGDGFAWTEDHQGNKYVATTGDIVQNVGGGKATTVNGSYAIHTDRMNLNAHSGASQNVGSMDFMCSGKSQYQYALAVLETIVLGGKVSTILAGGLIENLLAGARSIVVAAGAMSTAVPAGAYAVTVGAGGITMTCGAGAVAVTAGAGAVAITAGLAVAITAGLAINLTSPVAILLTSLQVLVGGPAAVLGVSRGLPIMPPGTPSLDWVTGLPLMGSATFRSLL